MSYGDFYFMRISTVNDDSDDLFPSPLYKCCDWKMMFCQSHQDREKTFGGT